VSARPSPLPLTARRRRRAAGERIAQLFEVHGRMVYGVCRLILRDPGDAEDAAQQTFLSAYRGLLAGQEPREPSAWLGAIARNECRARLRRRRTEPLTLVAEPSGDETQREVGRRAEAEALCTALAELPPQQRDAIVLREFYGLSYADVAAALGLSGPAVESLLFRSRRRLQEQLRPLRAALGVLAVPWTLRESLAQALPGFGGASAGAGLGAGALAKLGSAPFAAKLAAATLAIGTAGTVAGLERRSHQRAPERQPTSAQPAGRAAASLAARAPVSAPSTPAETTAETSFRTSSSDSARTHRENGDAVSSETGRAELEHESTTTQRPHERTTTSGSRTDGTSSHEGTTSSGGTDGSEHGGGGDSGTSGGDSSTSGGDGAAGSD